MDAGRPEQLTPHHTLDNSLRSGDRSAAPHRLARDDVHRRIIEIDSRLRREEPRLARQFRRLDRSARWLNALVSAVLAVSALLLGISVSYQTWPAGAAGVTGYVATLAIARRHRDGRRPSTRRAMSDNH